MKYWIIFSISLLTAIAGFSQKQFEGTIIYRLHAAGEPDEKEDAQLTIQFGKNAVKLSLTDHNKPDKQVLLIMLDSGRLYTLNTEEKNFQIKKLTEKKNIDSNIPLKKIAGFTTTRINIPVNPTMALVASISRNGTPFFYIADSLFYPIPEKYASNPELIFSHEGKIVLGLEIKDDDSTSDGYRKGMDGGMGLLSGITIEAISVKWETFDAGEFSIPADYVKYTYAPDPEIDMSRIADSTKIADSLIRVMMDTTAVPPTKSVKKTPVNSKQPAKPKTKTTSTKAGPVRKPE